MNRILLAEDDINLGSLLSEFLTAKGYAVRHASDGDEALQLFKESGADLIILDVMMPKSDGFTVAKDIRGTGDETPIIFLTAKSMLEDKLHGLKIGGDDYITKPFSMEELLLRINAVLRRTGTPADSAPSSSVPLVIGKFSFDPIRRILKTGSAEKKLTAKESQLLKLLAENKNQVTERGEALTKIWNEDNYFTSRSMDVYIVKLRSYLKDDPKVEIINVHGEGFKLVD